jgi:nucleoside-diphosphate-sugar epimerase
VADIAAVLWASIEKPAPGEIYNLADDVPSRNADVVDYAAKLMRVPSPPFVPVRDARASDMVRRFYQDRKQVSNRKIKEKLGVQLSFPSYREGLKNCLEQELS